ncbi:MAG: hypothetical protein RL684_2476, partial [Pseudomonadota bacterium]
MLKPDTKEGPIAYVENIRQST